jgi:hypothetical protein
MEHDYLPANDGAFLEWSKTLVAYATPYYTTWNIPSNAFQAIQMLLTDFEAAYHQAEQPNRGKVDVLRKNETRDAFKKELRTFVKAYLTYNPAVSNADRESMGLPIHDRKPTPVPKPKNHPDFVILVNDLRQLLVDFHEHESENKARPYGYNGAVISYAILEKPPAGPEELTHTVLATRTPFTLEFTEQERGKTVYIAIQWQNEKGEKGPFSAIQNAIIP